LRLDAAADGVANGTDKKKIIVLGGDGFCGWPTSLYLSDQGHDVVIVDNLSRRNIDTELGCDSLTPIQPPGVSLCHLLFLFYFCPLPPPILYTMPPHFGLGSPPFRLARTRSSFPKCRFFSFRVSALFIFFNAPFGP
jgi:hypothetical protein